MKRQRRRKNHKNPRASKVLSTVDRIIEYTKEQAQADHRDTLTSEAECTNVAEVYLRRALLTIRGGVDGDWI